MKKAGVAIVLTALLYCAGAGEGIINVWSGREQSVPVAGGSWTLAAEHGRELASGEGAVTLNLPALKPGTFVDALLTVGETPRKLRIWSPSILPALSCDSPKLKRIFYDKLGVTKEAATILATDRFPEKGSEEAKTVLVFPAKRAFPLSLEGAWDEISMLHGDVPGTLGVILDQKERTADNNGDWSCIILRRGKRRVAVFSPDFDFAAVDNILLLRRLLIPPKGE